jgi:uncharacterized protein with HEPN domain
VRDPKERLRDILEAIAAIERHLGGGKAAFERNELLQSWFLRHLQIIGEAARRLPPELQALAPDIPWPKVIGMRNVLVQWLLRYRYRDRMAGRDARPAEAQATGSTPP